MSEHMLKPLPPTKTSPTSEAAEESIEQACFDSSEFLDEEGYACDEWQGYRCSEAIESWQYTQLGQDDLVKYCPRVCRACGPAALEVQDVTADTDKLQRASYRNADESKRHMTKGVDARSTDELAEEMSAKVIQMDRSRKMRDQNARNHNGINVKQLDDPSVDDIVTRETQQASNAAVEQVVGSEVQGVAKSATKRWKEEQMNAIAMKHWKEEQMNATTSKSMQGEETHFVNPFEKAWLNFNRTMKEMQRKFVESLTPDVQPLAEAADSSSADASKALDVAIGKLKPEPSPSPPGQASPAPPTPAELDADFKGFTAAAAKMANANWQARAAANAAALRVGFANDRELAESSVNAHVAVDALRELAKEERRQLGIQ